ncbi:hypothetical protein HAX54_045981, partial [Datura stramonium]|nr:hypothetical protein [Datura stramonium]
MEFGRRSTTTAGLEARLAKQSSLRPSFASPQRPGHHFGQRVLMAFCPTRQE